MKYRGGEEDHKVLWNLVPFPRQMIAPSLKALLFFVLPPTAVDPYCLLALLGEWDISAFNSWAMQPALILQWYILRQNSWINCIVCNHLLITSLFEEGNFHRAVSNLWRVCLFSVLLERNYIAECLNGRICNLAVLWKILEGKNELKVTLKWYWKDNWRFLDSTKAWITAIYPGQNGFASQYSVCA